MILQLLGTYYQLFVQEVVPSPAPHKSADTRSEQCLGLFTAEGCLVKTS